MSTENSKNPALLEKVAGKEDFLLPKNGVSFMYQGIVHDLRKIDRPTAQALADDPKARFITWAPGKGPNAAKAATDKSTTKAS